VLQQVDAPSTLYHAPINVFVAGFIGSPAMNLVEVSSAPPQIGGANVILDADGAGALAEVAGALTVGFRPEALEVGDGPLRASIRTVEDLGYEKFVHVAVEHQGETLFLVSKMPVSFVGRPGDGVGLQITGTTHFFAEDGSRLASTTASLSGPDVVGRVQQQTGRPAQ
jgi:multiple sugar transport system ATP-binding protein